MKQGGFMNEQSNALDQTFVTLVRLDQIIKTEHGFGMASQKPFAERLKLRKSGDDFGGKSPRSPPSPSRSHTYCCPCISTVALEISFRKTTLDNYRSK